MRSNLLDAALDYAACGRAVLACQPHGKRPITRYGMCDATIDPVAVRAWWRRWPAANIGLACTRSSGFWALDIDPRNNGHRTLEALLHAHGPMPETRMASTGGGGWHFLFTWPDVGAREWRSALGPGVDVKANGYIIASPSIHQSGCGYGWANSLPLATTPAWLIELATKPAFTPTSASGHLIACPSAYIRAVVEREAARVAEAGRGERNRTLNAAAFALGRLFASGLDRDIAERELLQAAHACGLGAREACRTIASGLAGGARHPRQIPEIRTAFVTPRTR
jgi:hypothetical protein